MAILPDYRLDSLGSVATGAFLVGLVVLVVFATTLTSVVVGAAVLAVVLLALYYAGVRIDRRARGEY